MADYVGGDMIRGHIDTIILNSLIDGDKDTNQIRTEIEERAGGQFQLKQGTFYSALQRISKQGYVLEYRTTGADGVRRKFFQLTEKGKDYIDKNQSSWTMSRQVINTLLDAQADKNEVKTSLHEEKDEVLPDFEHSTVTDFSKLNTQDLLAEESDADLVISSLNDDMFVDETPEITEDAINSLQSPAQVFEAEQSSNSTPQTFDDIMEILEKIDRDAREEEERKIRLEEEKAERERILALEKAENEQENTENLSKTSDNATEIDEFEVAELQSKIPNQLEESNSENLEPQQEQMIISEVISSVSTDEKDDSLDLENLPTQKEYRDVLNRIFASENVQNVVEIQSKPIETAAPVQDEVTDDTKYDRIVEELDFENEKQENKKKNKTNKGAFDYSDILALSEKEGFKVTTSDKTNKNELGKILINRLNFHTSLIFFILIAFETLIVGLSMESVLKYGIPTYIYFSLITMLLPIVCSMLYYMAPKRTIAEVSTFKSAFETALIITLNLILMILVYVVIIDLDFSSKQELARNLFVPLLIVLNLPIYVIIRYSLLEKQMYFS